ncbi:AraC family transcriptional regulator [Paenibacillus periandrae]|uniref:AraC family transcriptional regulator n=1 Tax=Paenibacillus periandrae TaxID=1761741 RepID=UPI001F091AFB|nr:AraC family transcriptional regulator [Paenibacillus periandrae]
MLSDDILKNSEIQFKYRDISVANYPGFYHYHRGIEILFVHQGQGHIIMNRKMYDLNSGCIVLIQPFQLHRLNFEVSDQNPYERTVVTFEPSTFAPYFKSFPTVLRFFEHIWKEELSNQVFPMDSGAAYMSDIFERYNTKMSDRHGNEQLEAASILLIHILDYLKSLLEDSQLQGVPRTERSVEKIMQWVEEHYTEPFELSELAEELHLSRYHVSHLFRNETGSSITDYVIARRIRQACWLLKTESFTIEQIGSMVGIPNFSYFCRIFKKNIGVTPKQYRDSFI